MTLNAASISPGLATSPVKMNSQVLVDGIHTLLSDTVTSSKSMPCVYHQAGKDTRGWT